MLLTLRRNALLCQPKVKADNEEIIILDIKNKNLNKLLLASLPERIFFLNDTLNKNKSQQWQVPVITWAQTRPRGRETLTQINKQSQHWNQRQHQDQWSSTAVFPGTVHWLVEDLIEKRKKNLCVISWVKGGDQVFFGAPTTALLLFASITFSSLSLSFSRHRLRRSAELWERDAEGKKEGGVKAGEINEWWKKVRTVSSSLGGPTPPGRLNSAAPSYGEVRGAENLHCSTQQEDGKFYFSLYIYISFCLASPEKKSQILFPLSSSNLE